VALRKKKLIFALGGVALLASAAAQTKTMAEVLGASKPADWRQLNPADTLYLELDTGRVIIELAPQFAPQLVANLKTLVRDKYFDGLFILRAQDNYVVQWGDPDNKRSLGLARKTIPPEFERTSTGLPFTALPDTDAYAPQTGFVAGFPAARDLRTDRAWLTHCYGMVGVGRDNAADSGNGAALYAVIGHAPRHLDRNITLLGRVVQGMELLSVMPRGKGELGFYQKPEERTPVRSVRLASAVPEAERSSIELLRTDTQTFTDLIEARRNRKDDWTKVPAGHIEVCNVLLPARERATTK
jgi:peptidylprolyl isomerase